VTTRRSAGALALLALAAASAATAGDGPTTRPIDPGVASLIDRMGACQETESRAAYEQLQRVPREKLVPALVRALKHEAWPARAGAVRLLAGLHESRTAPAVAALMADQVWRVRLDAAEALGRFPAAACSGR